MPRSKDLQKSDLNIIIEKLDEIIHKLDSLSLNKTKVKREYKVPSDDERCIEIRKNGERCAGRIAKKSGDKKLCQLHFNKANGVDPAANKKSKAKV